MTDGPGRSHDDGQGQNPPLQRTVWALAAVFFSNGLVYASYVPRLPEIRDQSGVSLTVLGLALTAGSLAGLVGSFFAGIVIPRFGSKRIVVVGGALYAVALPGIGFSSSATLLVSALVLLAVFDVFVDVASNLQGSVVSALRKKPVMSRLHGAWSLGTLAGAGTAVLASSLAVPVGAHYVGVAVVVVAVLATSARFLRVTDEAHPRQLSDTRAAGEGPSWVWLGRAALLLGLANGLLVASDTAMGEWISLRLSDDLSASAGVAASAFLFYTAGLTLGRLGGDWLNVALGTLTTARLGVVIALIGLTVACFTTSAAAAMVGTGVTGLGISVLAPQLADAAARAPGRPGAGFSVLFAGHRIAGLVTPALVGLMAGAGGLSVGQAIALLAVPCSVLLLVLLRPTLRNER